MRLDVVKEDGGSHGLLTYHGKRGACARFRPVGKCSLSPDDGNGQQSRLSILVWRAALSLLLNFSVPAFAETAPDAGRILQETRPPSEAPPSATIPPIKAPTPERAPIPAAKDEMRVQVTHFTFTGNSALSSELLNSAVAEWTGRSLNFGQLIQVVEQIEARYKQAGYFLAQAYLPPQSIRDGAIEIAIAEGRLGETRLEGESRIAPDVVFAYLDRLPKGEALTLPILERQVLLINELAGAQAALDLQAGEATGTTDLVIAQKVEDAYSARIDLNNHGSPSTGEKRIGLTLIANSPFAQGERFTGNILTTETRNLASYNLRYEHPLGGSGLRLSGTLSRAEYTLGGAFAALKASGTADSWRVGLGYPLIRSRATNLRVQAEIDQSKLHDNFESTGLKLDKQSHGLTVSANGDALDELLGGGTTRADLSLKIGTLALGPDAKAADIPPAGPNAEGNFQKISINLQRQQTLTRDLSLQLQLTHQLASKNLDSSEKLGAGGPATLPGYANGEVSADQGSIAKIALRWQINADWALSAFTDYASLRLYHDPLPSTTVNQRQLRDVGLSADWNMAKGVSANLLVAWATGEEPTPTDNDKPRLWFNLAWAW